MPSRSAGAPRRRRAAWVVAMAVIIVVAVVVGAVVWVQFSKRSHQVEPDAVRPAPVVIVPGAAVWPGPRPSTYLQRRLQGALELYQAGKVSAILVSGAAPDADHDEPAVMRAWLEDKGVPGDRIVEDRAGVDTHDTCVRAHDVYQVTQAIIVTQDYHLPRALFLCEHAGIASQGVAVSSADGTVGWYQVREWGASVKAAFDVITARPPETVDAPCDELSRITS